jgi:hypothetical protein
MTTPDLSDVIGVGLHHHNQPSNPMIKSLLRAGTPFAIIEFYVYSRADRSQSRAAWELLYIGGNNRVIFEPLTKAQMKQAIALDTVTLVADLPHGKAWEYNDFKAHMNKRGAIYQRSRN